MPVKDEILADDPVVDDGPDPRAEQIPSCPGIFVGKPSPQPGHRFSGLGGDLALGAERVAKLSEEADLHDALSEVSAELCPARPTGVNSEPSRAVSAG